MDVSATSLSIFSIGGSLASVEGGAMATLYDRTVLPPDEPEQLQRMVEAMRAAEGPATLLGPGGASWELPPEAYRVLREVLEAMADGLAITVMPQHTRLTTQEAADMLGISRPTLVRLLGDGEIPYEQRGRHRRVLLTDVLDYQQRARVEQRKQLDDLVTEAAEHDLYTSTATPRPTR
ncbi:helix-turn-helix domain-containing protein [Pseudonocardia nantongensis]|uniref:helix-turn-helix domain-containing protein n=1 Tax=Pseudonocardia nantongensis TaxID=1181885 RepID=UPI00397E67B3